MLSWSDQEQTSWSSDFPSNSQSEIIGHPFIYFILMLFGNSVKELRFQELLVRKLYLKLSELYIDLYSIFLRCLAHCSSYSILFLIWLPCVIYSNGRLPLSIATASEKRSYEEDSRRWMIKPLERDSCLNAEQAISLCFWRWVSANAFFPFLVWFPLLGV